MSVPMIEIAEAEQRRRAASDPFATPQFGAGPRAATVTQAQARIACPHCAAHYRPDLVKWACPVCRTPTPGLQPPRRPPLRDDDRLILIVALATLANLVVLGILAAAVLS